MVLTGDVHSAWAADLSRNPNNGNVPQGGYDPATGAGSHAVEFITTSVTSPAMDDARGVVAAALRAANPPLKYVKLTRGGYMLLDIDANRVVSEWLYVDTVSKPRDAQSFGRAMQVADGANRLGNGTQIAGRLIRPNWRREDRCRIRPDVG